jgi:hypothetical protein
MRKIERLGLVLLEGSLGVAVRSCAGPYLRSEMRDSGARDGSFCSFFNCIGGVKRVAVDYGSGMREVRITTLLTTCRLPRNS